MSNQSDLFTLPTGSGDFNGDGRLDLATAALSMGSGDVTVLFGRGGGAFADGKVFATDPRPGAIATGDLDEDGRSDILTPSDQTGRLTVLYGKGDATFDVEHIVVDSSNAVAVGDFNGDGHDDAAVGSPGTVFVLLGHGPMGLDDPVAYATSGAGYGAIGAGDFNADGRDDIAATPAGPNNDSIAVLLGNADGTLQAPHATPLGNFPGGIAVGRFNADQRADVVVDYAFVQTPSVLLARADGTLGAPANLAATGRAPAVGDVDGDGRSDLAFGVPEGVRILAGSGDGRFSPFATVPSPLPLSTELGVELNGDGFDDLVLTHPPSESVIVGLNAPAVVPSPGALAFGSLPVGARSSAQRVTLTNDGQPPLAISGVAPGGANAGDFRITSQTCTGRPIAAGGTCVIDVDSAPTAAGWAEGHDRVLGAMPP